MPVKQGSKFKQRRKPVYGWGINDSDMQIWTKESGKKIYNPVYSRWISIVQRSNDPKEKERKPYYKDVYADDRWKHLTDFHAWLDASNLIGKSWYLIRTSYILGTTFTGLIPVCLYLST